MAKFPYPLCETPPFMDYTQMSGVSMDTLTEGIRSICGVTLDIFYGLGMSDGIFGHGWLLVGTVHMAVECVVLEVSMRISKH